MSEPVKPLVPPRMRVTKTVTLMDQSGRETVKMTSGANGEVFVETLPKQGAKRGPVRIVDVKAALEELL